MILASVYCNIFPFVGVYLKFPICLLECRFNILVISIGKQISVFTKIE